MDMFPNFIDDPKLRGKSFVFRDRFHAGELLASRIEPMLGQENLLFAIPSGGVPVAVVIAEKLKLPLELIIVRKIQIPWNREAGFGAVTLDGEVAINRSLVSRLGLTQEMIREAVAETMEVIRDRAEKFLTGNPLPELKGKFVFIVDDGLASGYTMLVAVKTIKKRNPKKVIVAVPTASLDAVKLLSPKVDKVICLNLRYGPYYAVADAYMQWYDVSDEEVIELLRRVSDKE